VLQVIYGAILWVVVPGIMVAMLIFSFVIPGYIRNVDKDKEKQYKVSAIAGFWAGLVLFVIYVLSQLQGLQQPDFSLSNLPSFDFGSLVTALIGAALGFSFLWLLLFLKTTPLIGLITLVLSAASSIALFSYIFAASRDTLMFITTGAIFGLLLHIVINPRITKEIWQ